MSGMASTVDAVRVSIARWQERRQYSSDRSCDCARRPRKDDVASETTRCSPYVIYASGVEDPPLSCHSPTRREPAACNKEGSL